MNHPKSALAAALAVVASFAATPSHATIILTSSEVVLTSSAYARADHITDSDAEAVNSGDAPQTSFGDSAFSYAAASNTTYTEHYPGTEDAYFEERTVEAWGNGQANMTIDALVNTNDAVFNISADTSAEGYVWIDPYAEYGRSAEGSVEAVAQYSAQFTLTSAYNFSMSFSHYGDQATYLRLQSADSTYFMLTGSDLDPIYPVDHSGVLAAGDYQLEVFMDCSGSFPPEMYSYQAGHSCWSALDTSFQLSASAVPAPAALPLFMSGLLALVGLRRRQAPAV